MKFIITSTITYDVDEKIINDFFKKENMDMNFYKREVCEGLKEVLYDEIGDRENMKNIVVETDMKVID